MKSARYAASVILILSILLPATVPALAAETSQPKVCNTSDELAGYILQMAGDREKNIYVSIPNSLPESDMDGYQLLMQIFRQDSGFIRWGHKSTTVKKEINGNYTTFAYTLGYRTTKEKDDAARRLAAAIVDIMDVGDLSAREKMDTLKTYISTNWRYDTTFENITAYSTLTSRKGTCLGFVMACQLLLNEMGIPSQTVHGKLSKANGTHIRLLVKLGKWWYTFDPTELASSKPNPSSYLQSNHVKSFVPNSEYLTAAFRNTYCMNPGDLGCLVKLK